MKPTASALALALALAPAADAGVVVRAPVTGVGAAPAAPVTVRLPGVSLLAPLLPGTASLTPTLPSASAPRLIAAPVVRAEAASAAAEPTAAIPVPASALAAPAPRPSAAAAVPSRAGGVIAMTADERPGRAGPPDARRSLSVLGSRPSFLALNAAFDGSAPRPGAEPTSVTEGGALAAPMRLARLPRARDAEGREVPHPTGLRALVRTHYLGILHDTAFKTFFSAWVTATLAPAQAGMFVSLATAVFTAPYLLLSAWAGRLADRQDKARLIGRLKVLELGLAAAGAVALAAGSPWAALAVVGLLGTRSAVMSPAKYSLLAERVPEAQLGSANGWLELSTFLSLVTGTAIGGGLASLGIGPWASVAFGAAAVLGWLASRGLTSPGTPAAPPAAPTSGPAPRMPRPLVLTGLAIAAFWLLSSLVQMNIFLYGAKTLGVGTGMVTALLTAIGVATGLGALAAGKVGKDHVELGIVPLGAAGVALFLADLALFGGGSVVRSFVDLSLLSVSAGLFYIPLNAYLQEKSPPEARGRFIGLSNLMTFAAILASAGLYWLLTAPLALSPVGVFGAAAVLAAGAAAAAAWFLRAPLAAFLRRARPRP